MINTKDQMLYSVDKLRDVLDSIEEILEGYEGIEGNKIDDDETISKINEMSCWC